MRKVTNQGRQNKEMTREQIEKQDQKNQVEFSSEYRVGNAKHQSQKKSGKQVNKK